MLTKEQQKLVEDNINLIYLCLKRINKQYDEDLFSIGSLGLCKAAKTYNPDSGFSFSTYACTCITNQIKVEYRKQFSLKALSNKDSLSLDNIVASSKDENLTFMELLRGRRSLYDEIIPKYKEFISSLPDRDKIILTYYLYGYSQQEIQNVLAQRGLQAPQQSYISRLESKLNKKFINKYYKGYTLQELEDELNGKGNNSRFRPLDTTSNT